MVASTMNLTDDKRFTLCLQLFFSQTIDMKVLASAGNIRDLLNSDASFALIHTAMTVT